MQRKLTCPDDVGGRFCGGRFLLFGGESAKPFGRLAGRSITKKTGSGFKSRHRSRRLRPRRTTTKRLRCTLSSAFPPMRPDRTISVRSRNTFRMSGLVKVLTKYFFGRMADVTSGEGYRKLQSSPLTGRSMPNKAKSTLKRVPVNWVCCCHPTKYQPAGGFPVARITTENTSRFVQKQKPAIWRLTLRSLSKTATWQAKPHLFRDSADEQCPPAEANRRTSHLIPATLAGLST